MDKICVVGLGYIGLPTAAILADHGYSVVGIDINAEAVAKINTGRAHIVEPDLNQLIEKVVASNHLQAKTQLTDDEANIYIIAVPTPIRENKKPDVSYVRCAIESMSEFLKKGDLVILESTSPVGTTADIARWLQALRPDLSIPTEDSADSFDISIAYCPERVLPGRVLHEIIDNDRVIGGLTKACGDKAAHFYRSFVKGNCFKTKARMAAMCKLTENAFRDVNIAFANELSMICDDLDIDVLELRELANRHPRVNILKPGPGVGGHCLAVDPWFIVDASPKKAKLISTARKINDSKPEYLVNKIRQTLRGIKNPSVLCLGLSYKPDIDDLRESPAVEVVRLLASDRSYQILVMEPHVNKLPEKLLTYGNISLVNIGSQIQYDYVVKLVEHTAFSGFHAQALQERKEVEIL